MYRYEQEPVSFSLDKIKALLQSARFIAAVVAGLTVLVGTEFGLDQELATAIVSALLAMILGDSIRPMEELLKSRRFWAFVGSLLAILASALGVPFPPGSLELIVITIAAWIVGDSWRVTLTRKQEQLMRAKAKAHLN